MARKFKLGEGKWATTDNLLLAYNDTNGNYKPLPMSFTRTSKATRVNENGLVEEVDIGQPRINFENNSKGEILIEHFRTNLVTESNNTTTSTWSHYNYGGGVIVDTYGYPSPNGKNEASRLVYTNGSTGSGGALLTTNITLLATGVYTISLWAKSVSGTKEIRYCPKNTGSSGPNGEIITLTNEWKRYTHTFTNDGATARGFQFRITETEDSGDRTFDVWGMTIEEGKFATSTIPTNGTSVSRTSDSFAINNAPILKATNQFTIYWEAKDFLYTDSSNTAFDNVMLIFGAGSSAYDSGTGVHVYNRTWYWYNGTTSVNIGNCYNALTDSKFALTYDGTKFTRYANGVKLGTYTASASMVNWDTLNSASTNDAQNDQRIWNLADLELYDTALTDAQLISKTSI